MFVTNISSASRFMENKKIVLNLYSYSSLSSSIKSSDSLQTTKFTYSVSRT